MDDNLINKNSGIAPSAGSRFVLLELANLEVDCKIGKDRHFSAADRKNNWRIFLGLFSVIGTAIVASKALGSVSQVAGISDETITLVIAVVSLCVGVSTAILGFLGLEKQVAQHRMVGNKYIEVARKSRRLINRIYEREELPVIRSEFEKLLEIYLEINTEGESCPTSSSDSRKSLEQNKVSRKKIKDAMKQQDDFAMQLASNKTTTNIPDPV